VNGFKSHFQSFAALGGPAHCQERTREFRAELARRGFAGFVVPRADRHQNEYVAASDERLLWLTGFSGSAGLAIVLQNKAALFVDGRYTVQARTQVDTTLFTIIHIGETTPSQWIEKNLNRGERLGYDPWLLTQSAVELYASACSKVEAELAPSQSNPVDAIWIDRPGEPLGAYRIATQTTATQTAVLRRR